jgi:4-amino-4-deoxy-L-arabinose transferase-like glycosyltransferase
MKLTELSEKLEQKNGYLWLTLLLAIVLSFWKLGDHEVHVWDEARQGITALEMHERGDYINYYYADQLDTWSAKPPLLIWCMTASYHVFGYNAFGMRVPAAIATILFFLFAFRLVRLYKSGQFAFLTCLILMSCHAILGTHIGRTADFDAFLLPSLTAFVFFFLRAHDFGKKSALLWAGVALGLAFYSKGTTAIFLLPGAVLYVLLSGTLLRILKDWRTYAALGIFAAFVGSWIYIILAHGAEFTDSVRWGANSVDTMFFYDTVARLTDSGFHDNKSDPFFFFSAIDIKLNLWNYVFYLGIVLGIVQLAQHNKQLISFVRKPENRLGLVSFCMIVSLGMLLSLSSNKLGWYLAPIHLFIGVIAMLFVQYASTKVKFVWIAFLGLFLFTFARHFDYLNSPETPMGSWIDAHQEEVLAADEIYLYRTQQQDLFLYLKWMNYEVRMITDLADIDPNKANALVFYEADNAEQFTATDDYEQFRMSKLP